MNEQREKKSGDKLECPHRKGGTTQTKKFLVLRELQVKLLVFVCYLRATQDILIIVPLSINARPSSKELQRLLWVCSICHMWSLSSRCRHCIMELGMTSSDFLTSLIPVRKLHWYLLCSCTRPDCFFRGHNKLRQMGTWRVGINTFCRELNRLHLVDGYLDRPPGKTCDS